MTCYVICNTFDVLLCPDSLTQEPPFQRNTALDFSSSSTTMIFLPSSNNDLLISDSQTHLRGNIKPIVKHLAITNYKHDSNDLWSLVKPTTISAQDKNWWLWCFQQELWRSWSLPEGICETLCRHSCLLFPNCCSPEPLGIAETNNQTSR